MRGERPSRRATAPATARPACARPFASLNRRHFRLRTDTGGVKRPVATRRRHRPQPWLRSGQPRWDTRVCPTCPTCPAGLKARCEPAGQGSKLRSAVTSKPSIVRELPSARQLLMTRRRNGLGSFQHCEYTSWRRPPAASLPDCPPHNSRRHVSAGAGPSSWTAARGRGQRSAAAPSGACCVVTSRPPLPTGSARQSTASVSGRRRTPSH